jgi:hypothetical protein
MNFISWTSEMIIDCSIVLAHKISNKTITANLYSQQLQQLNEVLLRSLRYHLCNKHYEDFDELKSYLTAFFQITAG